MIAYIILYQLQTVYVELTCFGLITRFVDNICIQAQVSRRWLQTHLSIRLGKHIFKIFVGWWIKGLATLSHRTTRSNILTGTEVSCIHSFIHQCGHAEI